MEKVGQHELYIGQDWGLFWGTFRANVEHRHYAIQLSISCDAPIRVGTSNDKEREFEAVLIKSNVKHRLACEKKHLLLLFNPIGSIGHFLSQLNTNPIEEVQHDFVLPLKAALKRLAQHEDTFQAFLVNVEAQLVALSCTCEDERHFKDKRILKALLYLAEQRDRVVPLVEIAKVCHLSPSRFLHLFKQELGITYRRAQLWIKIQHSFPFLQHHTITETAYQFGFSDSAHYSKVFKQNFGLPPKLLK
ncbi:helix-turn-helix transcriptional regulator [Aureispira anguillae]|uniref:Helix-turn-helix transcriptional regulator n=1 Tax=Aureispira anguillae TaxID=2864201 RepID=A0A915YI79_9BACT|nr:AraC family transcriptional regulator [Aureispira anguillae]BDS13663.1 helix-turn-helix transcriptional regulator [Aureispira anguillae]